MDKVKVFLAVMKKQHFWVISGLVLIVGLVGWFMATSTLLADYKASRNKIEGSFKDLAQLSAQERENDKWSDGLKTETKSLKVMVKLAWEGVYAEQRDKVLRWPKVLGEDFLRIVPQLAANEEIPVNQREHYWNYVQEEFPRLLEIVDARSYLDKPSNDESQMAGPRGKPAGKFGPPGARQRPGGAKAADPEEPPAHDYKVRWDLSDQETIAKRLDWTITPTTLEVRNTQEDLWVYQTLLTIIRHLNDRADGHHNAKVKEIRSLLIGHDAALQFQAGMAEGRIDHPGAATSQYGMAGAPGAMPGAVPGAPGAPGIPGVKRPPGAGMPGAGMPGAPVPGGAPAQGKAVEDAGRYVDDKGMPLAAASAAPPEFKRMPILMQLLIDQREISRLLVECANSPLPIEVRQLRVTPAERSTSVVGGRPVPGRNAGLQLGGAPGAPARPRMGGGNINPDEERDKNPYDVLVELQGIIYIFNPPDQAKLASAAPGDAATGDAATGEPGAAAEEAPDATTTEEAPARSAEDADADEPAAEGDKPDAEEEPAGDEAMDAKSSDKKSADSDSADSDATDSDTAGSDSTDSGSTDKE